MVTASTIGCPNRKNGPDASFNIGMAFDGIGVHNICVTNINNADLISKIGKIVLVVICTSMPKEIRSTLSECLAGQSVRQLGTEFQNRTEPLKQQNQHR